MQTETAIFLHITKAGGTTLNSILTRQYRPDQIVTLTYKQRDSRGVDEFKDSSADEKGKCRLVRGHIGFGIHEFLPQPASYFTILREPKSRLISHYFQIKQTLEERKRRGLIDEDRFNLLSSQSLEDYLELVREENRDNYQVRAIFGGQGHVYKGEVNESVLEVAKSNLRSHFSVVGVLEKFDEVLHLLKFYYGWKKHIFYFRRNVRSSSLKGKDFSGVVMEKLSELNEYDMHLYEYAKQLFLEKRQELGVPSETSISNYKAANASWVGLARCQISRGTSKISRSIYDITQGKAALR